MEIPQRDTPTPKVLSKGYGGDADQEAIQECMDVLRVAKKCLGHFYALFVEKGISPGKYSVLMELLALDQNQSLQPSELAKRIGVTRPTVTGIIDGLVRQGLVSRLPSEDDRRRVQLEISAEGRQFMEGLLPDQFAEMAALVNGLASQDRKSLNNSLLKLEASIDARST